MADESSDGPLEHFAPTGGRVTGVLGLLVAAGVVVVWVVYHDEVVVAVAAGALVAAVFVWTAMLRPRVSVGRETLVLRNMLETIHVPLAAIDELVVRQVLAVRVGDKRFVSPAVGRKLRKLVKRPSPSSIIGPTIPESMDDGVGPKVGDTGKIATDVDYVDHIESRIRHGIADARARRGIRAYSDESEALADDVRREPAWLEIGALVATVLLFVVTLLV